MNHIVTNQESTGYGDIIRPGDLVIDTYTKDRQVLYYKMSESWPTFENERTIWVHGNLLSDMTDFKLMNGQSGENYFPWHIWESSIKTIPGTQVKTNADADYSLCCHGLKYLTIDGDLSGKKGLNSHTSRFKTGNFGFKFHQNKTKGQILSLSVLPGGMIKLRNIEGSGGFALKINGYTEGLVDLDFENVYIRDTVYGEGIYAGSTQPTPVTKFSGRVKNVVLARTACEALQLQHCYNLHVSDIKIFAANTGYIKPFEPNQDTGIQWVCAGGVNILENVTVDGFSSIGLNLFGGDGINAYNEARNIKFYNGRGSGIYVHNSCKTNAQWNLHDIEFNGMNGEYFAKTKTSMKPFTISQNNGTDRINQRNISTGNKQIRYVNSGFDNSSIVQWKPYWIGHLQGGNQEVLTTWKKDEVVIDTNGGYGFYKCLEDHTTDLISPKASQYFQKLTWDENGIRNDKEEWSNTKQSEIPPDDLRELV